MIGDPGTRPARLTGWAAVFTVLFLSLAAPAQEHVPGARERGL